MDKSSYLNLDMRLLNTFLVIMETQSLTAAAYQLNVSQSAVSHGLKRLRVIFGDQLFIRVGRGIKPTLRAQQLYEEFKPMLANIRVLSEATEFDPHKANISWTVAANDLQRDVLLPDFYQSVSQQVESFSLNVVPSEVPAVSLLNDDVTDLVISPLPPDAPGIMQTRLFSTGISCFYDSACRAAPTTIKDFKQAHYIGITFTAGISFFGKDHPLASVIDKNVRVRVANFAGLASFLRGSELLVITPSLLKNTMLKGFGNVPIPDDSLQLNMYMLWHQVSHENVEHQWLRAQMLAVSNWIS